MKIFEKNLYFKQCAQCTLKEFLCHLQISINASRYESFFVFNDVGQTLLGAINTTAAEANRKFIYIDAFKVLNKADFINDLETTVAGSVIIIDNISEVKDQSIQIFLESLFSGISSCENIAIVPEILNQMYHNNCIVIGIANPEKPMPIRIGEEYGRMIITQ